MKDKFSIFAEIISLEQSRNHYGIYIAIGQLSRITIMTNNIYNNWNATLSLKENVATYFERNISPLGSRSGKNRI